MKTQKLAFILLFALTFFGETIGAAWAADCDDDESRNMDTLESWYKSGLSEDEEDDHATPDFWTLSDIHNKLEDWADNECFDGLVDLYYLSVPDGDSEEEIYKEYSDSRIPYLRIGSNVGARGKPAILITSGVHAREWLGPIGTMYLVNRLIYDYQTDSNSRARQLLNEVELIVVPLLNPDGTAYVQEEGNTFPWYEVFDDGFATVWDIPTYAWRKTLTNTEDEWDYWGSPGDAGYHPNDNELPMSDACRGVDLNRHWNWNRPDYPDESGDEDEYYGNVCLDDYPGAVPESEIETQGVKYLIKKNPQIIRILDIHDHHAAIYRPTTQENTDAANQLYEDVTAAMEDKMNAIHFDENADFWEDWREGENAHWRVVGPAQDWTYPYSEGDPEYNANDANRNFHHWGRWEDREAAADDKNRADEDKKDRWKNEQTAEPGMFKNWANANGIFALTLELPPNVGIDDGIKCDHLKFVEVKPRHVLPVGKEVYPGLLEFLDFRKEGDPDGDGVFDLRDNCIGKANYLQRDCDGDGIGDACDNEVLCSRNMMMVLDESGSMNTRVENTKVHRFQHVISASVATLVSNYLHDDKVMMGIMDFNDDPGCISGGSSSNECQLIDIQAPIEDGATPDESELEEFRIAEQANRIYEKYNVDGLTNIVAAIDQAGRSLENGVDPPEDDNIYGEKILFILTDGKQTVDSEGRDKSWYKKEYTDLSREERNALFWDDIHDAQNNVIEWLKDKNIVVNALAVTQEADEEMLTLFTRETKGHFGYAYDAAETPIAWEKIEIESLDKVGALDIGTLTSPKDIYLEQEPDGIRQFDVSEDATAFKILLSNNGYGFPLDDTSDPVEWALWFNLWDENGSTPYNNLDNVNFSVLDDNTMVIYVANPASGTWTLATEGSASLPGLLSSKYIISEVNPSLTVRAEVDNLIVEEGKTATVTPSTIVYNGVPIDANTTDLTIIKVEGPGGVTIYEGDDNAFGFDNTGERELQGLPPTALIEPFNGRGYYTVYIEVASNDTTTSIPGTSLNGTVNDFKQIYTVTFFADVPEMPECATSDCDNDGYDDDIEGDGDLDFDGWPNYYDLDSDGDEIPDKIDKCPFDYDPEQKDADNDGIGDACDADMTCMFGTDSVWVGDRAILDTTIGSNDYIELGADAIVTGELRSGGNVFLRERSSVIGDVWTGGILETQNDTAISGDLFEGALVNEMNISVHSVDYSIVNVDVSPQFGCAQTLDAGSYGVITVHAGCTLTLQAGIYDAKSFNMYADAQLQLNGNVELNVESVFQFGDRASVEGIASPEQFLVYSNQQSQLRIGVDADFTGHILAPNADVAIFTHATVEGCTHSKTLHIEPEVTLIGEEFPAPKCGNGVLDEGEVCDDGNASNNDDCLTTCQAASCADGFWAESTEADVDCGGVCDACEMGKNCNADEDCQSGLCEQGVCAGDLLIDATIHGYYPWNGVFCANIVVTNNGTADVTSWRVQLNTGNAQIAGAWNATFTMMGNELAVEGTSLSVGETHVAGYCTWWYPFNPTVIDTAAY